ncbi:rCG22189 [Rattus norvegicus]|uniref:RCG22189 n=1 Tax=Rattus norvegicus TaxID=10116 RepID=A6IPD5_RAT|nr:rCG22189 [Rattus norvegicus]
MLRPIYLQLLVTPKCLSDGWLI